MSRKSRKTLRAIGVTITLFLVFIQTRSIVSELYSKTRNPHHAVPSHWKGQDAVDWSRFAYSQYATNEAYLCNSVMIFETLHRLQSKADRFLMYPLDFSVDENDNGTQSRLLRKARDEYNAKLVPVELQTSKAGDRM